MKKRNVDARRRSNVLLLEVIELPLKMSLCADDHPYLLVNFTPFLLL